MFEHFGLSDLQATASATSGAVKMPNLPTDLPDPPLDFDGRLTATAASVYHAGIMGEMILAGEPWQGPVWYARHSDYQIADDMLSTAFGRHSSAGHAYAQRLALHVLAARWPRVQEIAKHLIQHGVWGQDAAA